jgi:hypothetical protein
VCRMEVSNERLYKGKVLLDEVRCNSARKEVVEEDRNRSVPACLYIYPKPGLGSCLLSSTPDRSSE